MIERFDLKRKSIDDQLIPFNQKEELKMKRKELYNAIDEAIGIVDFLYDEGEIKQIGKYRIFIPYFKLPSGNNSFYYLKEDRDDIDHKLKRLNDGYYWIPNFDRINFSLKGIKIQLNHPFKYSYNIIIPSAYIEVDIDKTNDSAVSVSRHLLKLDNTYGDLINFINDKLLSLILLNQDLFNNTYNSINKKFVGALDGETYWTDGVYEADMHWNKIEFPFIKGYMKGTYQNVKLRAIAPITSFFGYDSLKPKFDFRQMYQLGIAFNRTVLNKKTKTFYFPIAIKFLDRCIENSCLNYIEFPQELNQLIFFLEEKDIIISVNSHLFKYYDDKTYLMFENRILDIDINDLTTKNTCFTFLILCVNNYRKDNWLGLCEKYGSIIQFAFNQLNIENLYGLSNDGFILVANGRWEIPIQEEIDLSVIKNLEPYLIKNDAL